MTPEYVLYNDVQALVLKKYKNAHGNDILYDLFVFTNPPTVFYGVSDTALTIEVKNTKDNVLDKGKQ